MYCLNISLSFHYRILCNLCTALGWTVYNSSILHCTMYTLFCAAPVNMPILDGCTLYNVQCTLFTLNYILYNV